MRYLRIFWKELLSLIFTVGVCSFWALGEVHMLNYQEQYQMFLFTTDYFCQDLASPGGFADYLAEFITQFNYHYIAGSVFLSLLFLAFQRLTWMLMRTPDSWFPLSFIPPIQVLAYMGDADAMPSFLVALILTECLMLLWQRLLGKKLTVWTCIALAFLFPVCYWLIGPCVLIFTVYILIYEMTESGKPVNVLTGIAAAVYALAVIYVIAQFRPEPYYRLFGGLNYYRYPDFIPLLQIVVMAVVAIFPFLGRILPVSKAKIAVPLQLIVIIIGGCVFIHSRFNNIMNETIAYDYLVRTGDWDAILNKAVKKPAESPMEVSCVNFALSQKGELDNRLFNFFQNGTGGLIPVFQRNLLLPVSTAEIFYSLGMVNDCERFMFEAQQAIPNFKRSSRLSRRIIECEIINGQYAVAKKLLGELENTLFYRSWAKDMLAMLDNPKKEEIINEHPVYGSLRKLQVTKDFLFDYQNMDLMIRELCIHNRSNRIAYEYLVAYGLLNRNMR